MKSRAIYVVAFSLGFVVAFSVRTGIQALKVRQYGQQRYQEGHTAGVEEVRKEAVREGHASYMDRDSDQVSEFRWNVGRPDWTGGGEGMGLSEGEMSLPFVSLLK